MLYLQHNTVYEVIIMVDIHPTITMTILISKYIYLLYELMKPVVQVFIFW